MKSLTQLEQEHLAKMHETYTENCIGCEYRKEFEEYEKTLSTRFQFIHITDNKS